MAKIQPGNYYGRLAEAGMDTLNNEKQTMFMYLTFSVTNVFINGAWQDIEPVNRDVKLFMSDKARPYTERTLETLGFNGDFENPQFKPELHNGTELVCTHNAPPNGKEYEEWNLSGGQRERTAPNKDKLKRLRLRWSTNKTASTVPPNPSAAANIPPTASQADNNNNDDGIPF